MQLPYADTIFLGIIRLFFWILFIYVIKRLFFRDKTAQNQVKTMGYAYAYYGSFLLVLIFILVQLSSYDFFTIILILFGFFTWRAIGFSRARVSKDEVERKRKMILLRVIENIEDRDPIVDIQQKSPRKVIQFEPEFLVVFLACITALLVRFYFIQFDNYQLTTSWFQELQLIKGFSSQRWFNSDNVLIGHYALINFYAMITGISHEIALESFGLLQAFLVCFIIFWFVNSVTYSQVAAPLVGALVFAVFFNLVPINLSQIVHAKSTWTAMTLALPAMVFICKPRTLFKRKPDSYFLGMAIIFGAIGFVDLFVLMILMPQFFLVSLLFVNRNTKSHFLKAVSAYVVATTISLFIYWLATLRADLDFIVFIKSNLLAVSTSTSLDDLILDYSQLMIIFQAISWVMVVTMFFLFRKNRKKWMSSLVFLIYFNVLIIVGLAGFRYFDIDLFNEIFPIILACAAGIFFYMVQYVFKVAINNFQIMDRIAVPLIFMAAFGLAYFSQQHLLTQFQKKNVFPKNMIEAYQRIGESFLPYSYEVVNTDVFITLSENEHFFSNHSDFINNYASRDSLYFAKKEDLFFLKEHPEAIIPNSILLFVYSGNLGIDRFSMEKSEINHVQNLVTLLKERGREVREFYSNEGFKVLEIVNVKAGARIDELL